MQFSRLAQKTPELPFKDAVMNRRLIDSGQLRLPQRHRRLAEYDCWLNDNCRRPVTRALRRRPFGVADGMRADRPVSRRSRSSTIQALCL